MTRVLLYLLFIFCTLTSFIKNDTTALTCKNNKEPDYQTKIEILEQRLEQSSDTISSLEALTSGFSTLYTIITIIIALIGIIVPILTYQFGIRPSKEAVKDLEHSFDLKLEKFLTDTRNNQIDSAIENLESNEIEVRNNAISYLSISQYQGFSEVQLFNIFKILKRGNLDMPTFNSLAYLISNRESEFAKDFFETEMLSNTNSQVKYSAIRYFCLTGIENYESVLLKIIKSAGLSYMEYSTILSWTFSISTQEAVKLLNSKTLVDSVEEGYFNAMFSTIESSIESYKYPREELYKTYLATRLAEINKAN